MTKLSDLSLSELESAVEALGEKKYRAKDIFRNIALGKTLDEMTSIPKTLKSEIAKSYDVGQLTIHKEYLSKDGTRKYLLRLCDGNIIECVVMQYKYGRTICISTEVGCAMGCAFCASGIGGLVRKLSCGEILEEVAVINRALGGDSKSRAITNIVLMGSGEPFDNYDAVVKFLRLVNDENGLNISCRNISVSTAGIVPKIYAIAEENLPITLTISLHSTDNATRSTLMPINKVYPLEELVAAAKAYYKKTGRRVIFEYAMIKRTNDSTLDAARLAQLVSGFPHHINLISLNYVKEKPLKPSGKESVKAFMEELEKRKVSVTMRRTMGADIDSACGQLRRRFLNESNGESGDTED